MFRQRTGSVVCASCGSLVGVNDDKCYTCGRRNPGLWGFGPVLRRFGNDLGFVTLVVYGCTVLYAATLLVSLAIGEGMMSQSLFSLLGPGTRTLFLFGASGPTRSSSRAAGGRCSAPAGCTRARCTSSST